MEVERAVLLIAELLNMLVDHVIPDCGIDCDGCEYFNQCEQMTKVRDTNSELQRILAD